jgi:hypothetical protein
MTLTTRTGMRRCGKPYASEAEAMNSKRGRGGGFRAEQCPLCPDWHLRRIPMGTRTVKPSAIQDTGPDAATRALVLARDGYQCVRCGKPCGPGVGEHSLQHRRARGTGGGSEVPNLILLCGSATTGCHAEVERRGAHDNAAGYWLNSWQDPATEGVMYASEHGSGITMWLLPDGSLSPDGPERAA